ncbi:hypothetical protein FZ983_17080 [Azospirillum sp. B21]|uniref:hypothetical protein n=1 Tax=Azospirillum sp. B21 TaxID=2607496 RepID=UPI0011EBBED8|nr:hypothetical protein [Azospirillum sp. B21]KAA0579037.1 hypothetical protein FZ983_17080 [Azospirillum sp. B21]
MARGRRSSGSKPSKAEQLRERARGLQSHQFFDFLDEVSTKRQDLADANTEHASAWKKADALGIHPRAAKQIARLDKMDAVKRADELRSFDQMRRWMAERWGGQPDIFEQDATPLEEAIDRTSSTGDEPQALGDVVRQMVEDAGEDAGPKPLYDVASPPDLPGQQAEASGAPEADWGDDGAEEVNPELDNAGYTFANGRTAGRQGHGPEANPHLESSPSHVIWERGRVQGALTGDTDDDLLEAVSGEPEPAEEPKPRSRRRSRGTDAAGAAAVH